MSLSGPDANDPTLNVWTGLIGPVELTTVSILPVVTLAAVKCGTDLAFRYCWPKCPAAASPPARTARMRSHLTSRRMRVVRGKRTASVAAAGRGRKRTGALRRVIRPRRARFPDRDGNQRVAS